MKRIVSLFNNTYLRIRNKCNKQYIKKLLKISYIFSTLGLLMLGNLTSIVSVMEEKLVKKYKMAEENDILDAVSIARCGPGAAVVNTVVFLGNKFAGFLGGIVAAISFAVFPFLIIIIIAFFLEKFIECKAVMSAFKAISVVLSLITIDSIISMGKKALYDKITITIFIVTIILEIVL